MINKNRQRRPARAWPVAMALATMLAYTAHVPKAEAKSPSITISYSERVGDNLPLWIAQDGGYFKKNGLDVTLRYLPTQQGIAALLSNQIQMAGIGGSDAISAAAQGMKLKYIATLSPVLTFQLWAHPKFASAAALKGQRVGTTTTTGSLYIALLVALNKLGLSPSDVAITPLGPVPNVNAALLAGSIVASTSHPPATYIFKQHGLVDLVDLAKERIPNINTGIVMNDAYLQAHPAIAQKVVNAIVEALHREKTDEAFTLAEIRKHLHVKDPKEAAFTYKFYANEVAPTYPMPAVEQFKISQQMLGAHNAKVKAVDVSTLIDQSFVKKAEAEHLADKN